MRTIDEMLAEFYNDVLTALKDPENNPWFQRRYGLCTNLDNWCNYHRAVITLDATLKLSHAQDDLFRKAGLDRNYPFNGGDGAAYRYEHLIHYENPRRLAWIEQHAEKV